MSESRWRRHAKVVISRVLEENKDADEATIKKALQAAYPFGERQYYPYQIWLDEVRTATGKQKPADHNGRRHKPYKPPKEQERLL